MENINLMFTGDIPAVEAAHNLCAAAIDASILHGKEVGDKHRNPLNIDPLNVTWTYCVDANARALRDVMVGLGGIANGYPRLAHYDITVATETAAIHDLALGLKDGGEMQSPLAVTVIGGLLVSTALTLVLIPVYYYHFESRKEQGRVKAGSAAVEETY